MFTTVFAPHSVSDLISALSAVEKSYFTAVVFSHTISEVFVCCGVFMGAVRLSRSYIRAKVLMHLQLNLRRHQESIFVRFLGKKQGIKNFQKIFIFLLT